jgi:RimJ/RimL family protein N-acetyltransferase
MAKRTVGPLCGERVTLRLLEPGDLGLTREWRNQDHIRRWFFHPDVVSSEQHEAWFARYRERDDDFVFVIEETRDLRRPVGQVSLYGVDWERGRAEYGRLMVGDPDAAGRGLAREATQVLLDWALGPLGLREVYLEVMADNLPAIAVYRACGFSETGGEDGVVRMARTRESD